MKRILSILLLFLALSLQGQSVLASEWVRLYNDTYIDLEQTYKSENTVYSRIRIPRSASTMNIQSVEISFGFPVYMVIRTMADVEAETGRTIYAYGSVNKTYYYNEGSHNLRGIIDGVQKLCEEGKIK